MGAYSLQILDADKYLCEYEEELLCDYENFYFKEHFRVGGGIENFNKTKHRIALIKALQNENCEIVQYIHKKIEGLLEELCDNISQGIKKVCDKYNTTPSCAMEMCCNWEVTFQ